MGNIGSTILYGFMGLSAVAVEVGTVLAGKRSFNDAKSGGACCYDNNMNLAHWPCSSVNATMAERSKYCEKVNNFSSISGYLPILAPLLTTGVCYMIAKKQIALHKSEEASKLLPKATVSSSPILKKVAAICTSTAAQRTYFLGAGAATLSSLASLWFGSITAEDFGKCVGKCISELQTYQGWSTAYTVTTVAAPLFIAAFTAAYTYSKITLQEYSEPLPHPASDL